MIRKTLLLLGCLMMAVLAEAQSWERIRTSGEFYWGEATAASEAEADEAAVAALVQQIEAQAQGEFKLCVKTYARTSLRDEKIVERWPVGTEPKVTMRRYIKRRDLARICDDRIAKARDMVTIAGTCLQNAKVDVALQYYYWAYTLLRSVQRPTEVKDEQGHVLVEWLPRKIEEILGGIAVTYDKSEDEWVDLLFTYNGRPVSSLQFAYNDGSERCTGIAKDGRSSIQQSAGNKGDCRIAIEYEYMQQARGDRELVDVLAALASRKFAQATLVVQTKGGTPTAQKPAKVESGVSFKPKPSQTVANVEAMGKTLAQVISAITTHNHAKVAPYFTPDGFEIYNQLITYGQGRIVGTPHLCYFKGMRGTTVARGLQMSFVFTQAGRKTTFVEDVAFTFNAQGKIENVAFGLGNVVENDILCRDAEWKDETREMLMEFLENYKTAYCLKRLDYIRSIFSDDAVIIIGNVTRPSKRPVTGDKLQVTVQGQETIRYNRYDKNTYLKNLERSFNRNEFINLRFTTSDIQWLDKWRDKEIFGIQLGQEYVSSTYSDKGYLFLMVDMTNHDEPLIKVRTWQPNELSQEQIYNAGNFFNY